MSHVVAICFVDINYAAVYLTAVVNLYKSCPMIIDTDFISIIKYDTIIKKFILVNAIY